MTDEKILRIHDRMDKIEDQKREDLKDIHNCLTGIKSDLSTMAEAMKNQKEQIDKLNTTAAERKRIIKYVDRRVEKHAAECPASDITKLKEKGLLKAAKDHPYLSGSGVGSAAGTLIYFLLKLL